MSPWGADPDHSLKCGTTAVISNSRSTQSPRGRTPERREATTPDLPPMPTFAEGWTAAASRTMCSRCRSISIPAKASWRPDVLTRRCRSPKIDFAETPKSVRASRRVHHLGVFVVTFRKARHIDENGRLIAPTGKATTDRGEGLAGRADTTALPVPTAALVVPGRGVDTHRADIGKRFRRQVHQLQVTTTRPANPKKIARSSASGSTRCRVTHELLIRQAGRSARDDEGRPVAYPQKEKRSSTRG